MSIASPLIDQRPVYDVNSPPDRRWWLSFPPRIDILPTGIARRQGYTKRTAMHNHISSSSSHPKSIRGIMVGIDLSCNKKGTENTNDFFF